MKTVKIKHFYWFRNPRNFGNHRFPNRLENQIFSKRISKKSQISMFVILGIILLVITGFTVYIINYSVKKQAQREVKTSQKQGSRTEAIENYITTCLEKTTKKGLKLIGNQGGVIYKDQDGLTEAAPDDYVTKDTTRIWYGIKEPVTATCSNGDGCLNDCETPDPDCNNHLCGNDGFCVMGCNSVDYDCGSSQSSTCSQGDGCHAGCITPDPDCGGATCKAGDHCIADCIPKDPDCSVYTCDEDGFCALGCSPVDTDCAKNDKRGYSTVAPLYPWKCFPKSIACYSPKRYTGYFGRSLLLPLEGLNSVKSQLNSFIKKDIVNCIDLTAFEEQGFDIVAGKTSIDVVFAEKDTIVNLNYPLSINHYRTGEKAALNEFSYKLRANIKGIYNYTEEIVTQDTTNIKYNPAASSKDSFTVNIDRLANDDIITITDSNSIIDGAAYQLRFARKNRRPALEMIVGVTIEVNEYVDELFNKVIQKAGLHDPDEDIDCSSFTIVDCDGDCLLADCTGGSIKLECPTILDFKKKKKIGGPITQNKPGQEPEKCTATISDGFLEDYQDDIKVTITPGND